MPWLALTGKFHTNAPNRPFHFPRLCGCCYFDRGSGTAGAGRGKGTEKRLYEKIRSIKIINPIGNACHVRETLVSVCQRSSTSSTSVACNAAQCVVLPHITANQSPPIPSSSHSSSSSSSHSHSSSSYFNFC